MKLFVAAQPLATSSMAIATTMVGRWHGLVMVQA